MCENGIGMTCASDGSFALEYFDDSYCMQPSGKTYDQLSTLNSNMNTYSNCQNIYQYGDQYGNVLVPYLMSISYPCTSVVSGLCVDSASAETRQEIASSNGGSLHFSRKSSGGSHTWLTKLKYVAGGLLLLASFVMFTGILFTNRRRRRALMQRKYRQARRSGDDRSRRSSRSKSKGRERDSSRKSRRSSRSRDARDKEKSGVFT